MIADRPEQVYVVPRRELFPDGVPHGFVPLEARWIDRIYDRGFFADRDRVEDDPTLKQVIPYAVLARAGDVFLFRRTNGGGEKRLFNLRSIGVGGHVNPEDAGDVVRAGLRREVEEELSLPSAAWEPRILGLLNDDSTPVGEVHVGVVALVVPGPGPVAVREEDTMTGSFVGRDELMALHARERGTFESWSALLLDRLDEVLAWRRDVSSIPTPRATRTSTT